MSLTGGDRFLDGRETFQYSPKSQPELNQTIAGVTNNLDKLQVEIDEKISQIYSVIDQHYTDTESKIAELDQHISGVDQVQCERTMFLTSMMYPLTVKLLCSKLMRFINWFVRWYYIDIAIVYRVQRDEITHDEERVPSQCSLLLGLVSDRADWRIHRNLYKTSRRIMRRGKYSFSRAVRVTLEQFKE